MRLIAIIVIALSFSAFAWAQAGSRPGVSITAGTDSIKLNDLAVAPRVVDKEPDGASDSHPANVGLLYCWSSLQNSGESTTVKHVWRHGEQVVVERDATVGKSTRWRSWTRQRINPNLTGAWSCEVVDDQGTSLGKAEFTVQ